MPSAIAPGAFAEVTLNYTLPISGPSNFTLAFGGQTYALAADYARGGVAPTGTTSPAGSSSASTTPTASVPGCTAPPWTSTAVYTGGDQVSHNGRTWRARWWTQGEAPSTGGSGVWEDLGPCGPATTTTRRRPPRPPRHHDPDHDTDPHHDHHGVRRPPSDADRRLPGVGAQPGVRDRRPGQLRRAQLPVPAGPHLAARLGAAERGGALAAALTIKPTAQ